MEWLKMRSARVGAESLFLISVSRNCVSNTLFGLKWLLQISWSNGKLWHQFHYIDCPLLGSGKAAGFEGGDETDY
ncbi:MAG: hypothetical protein LBU76_06595 [Azoarcus sp.]|jgi:hypothetical protein|nr:hypothetical protein [Azoarcus sp.]